jgi:membrane fusion protein (multidrug efflux system)
VHANRFVRFAVRGALPLVLLVLPACSGGDPPPPPPEPVPEVVTATVRSAPAERTITAVGALEPVARVLVAAQAEGVVTAVHVREGDRVTAGQLLVELDRRELEAEMAQATAALEEAEATLKRVSSLRSDGLISEQELDSAQAAQRIAAAKVEALRTRLSFTRIVAPVSGVVVSRKVEVGNLASSRSPLFELASGSGLLLRVPVSELEVVKLDAGDPATVTVDALPNVTLAAHIQRLFPAADSASRQVTVELKIDNPPPAVRYGFLARAHLVVERIPEALTVPEEAVQRGSEGSFVWAVADGVAQMRQVKVGDRLDGRALIDSGLAAGDRVVVQGTARLRDGLEVKAKPLSATPQP